MTILSPYENHQTEAKKVTQRLNHQRLEEIKKKKQNTRKLQNKEDEIKLNSIIESYIIKRALLIKSEREREREI